jgi:hypothetical protein
MWGPVLYLFFTGRRLGPRTELPVDTHYEISPCNGLPDSR